MQFYSKRELRAGVFWGGIEMVNCGGESLLCVIENCILVYTIQYVRNTTYKKKLGGRISQIVPMYFIRVYWQKNISHYELCMRANNDTIVLVGWHCVGDDGLLFISFLFIESRFLSKSPE